MKFLSCSSCAGFVPPTASFCPHCSAKVEGLLPLLSRTALAVVGGSAVSMTLMACYGLPPCEDTGIDADDDGFVTAQGASCGCFELDCNDEDASIHPGADDPVGDGVDQNCYGEDGVVTICSVDTDCPAEKPSCNLDTGRCDIAAAEGEGEGEGEGE